MSPNPLLPQTPSSFVSTPPSRHLSQNPGVSPDPVVFLSHSSCRLQPRICPGLPSPTATVVLAWSLAAASPLASRLSPRPAGDCSALKQGGLSHCVSKPSRASLSVCTGREASHLPSPRPAPTAATDARAPPPTLSFAPAVPSAWNAAPSRSPPGCLLEVLARLPGHPSRTGTQPVSTWVPQEADAETGSKVERLVGTSVKDKGSR